MNIVSITSRRRNMASRVGVRFVDTGKTTQRSPLRELRGRILGLSPRKLTIAAFLAATSISETLATALPSSADDDNLHKTVDGLSVYIGVMPAAIVKGHPVKHVEATMHNGPPSGRHEYHLVVAVFDDASGQRVSDAVVKVGVSELGKVGVEVALEPKKIAGVITYGGFVAFPSPTRYAIRVTVARPNVTLVSLELSYDHQPP